MTTEVRILREADAAPLLQLRRRALVDAPFAFLASPEDDLASSVEAVRAQLAAGPDSVVFGAVEPELVGMLGLSRDRHIKAAHRVWVWGVFVAPECRGRGVGGRLLDAALSHARTLEGVIGAKLSVSEKTPAARRLYERAGFRLWGVEPDAVRVAGQSAREYHLSLTF